MAIRKRSDTSPNLFTSSVNNQPLAARMRPRTLDDIVGQQHLLAPGKALRHAIERGNVSSMILWGPPGTGKTTLARVIANVTHRVFVPFSAVSEGVPRIRQIVGEAEERLRAGGQPTILFIDEIHRLNKSQQDSLLPHVEEGTVTLIGATTETPSFEINGALLSRSRVFVLEALKPAELQVLLRRALTDAERGLAGMQLDVTEHAIEVIAELADGDARRALTVLEAAAMHVGEGGRIDEPEVREALQLRFQRADKSGEEHYNMLSAYHKSLRGSDPQAALYWMARMIEGGADPMTLFRRAMAMAAEDIGLADPEALKLAVAARDAFHMLGPPEGYLPLVEMTIYLATAPKSNAVVTALHAALEAARNTPAAPVPLNIRNAPTRLHEELGYHEGYQYAHDSPDAYIPQQTLPEGMQHEEFYKPGRFGFEREIARRLEWWASLKRETESGGE
jgi:putative ATPase